MEITTDTRSSITILDRASFNLQNTILQHSHHYKQCNFTKNKQEPACHTHKNLHQCRRPTFSQQTLTMTASLPGKRYLHYAYLISPIHSDELTEVSVISKVDSCVELVTHITIASVEIHYLHLTMYSSIVYSL